MESQEVDVLAKKVWNYMLMHHELRPVDAILALGSHDTNVANRAGDLYLAGYAPYVICSGDSGKASKFEKPEAEVFADILYEMGVPKNAVLIENRSTNTGENILFTRELLEEKGFDFNSFMLVMKPYVERRAYAAFKKLWPEAECLVTSPQVSYEEYGRDPEFKTRFISIMVGDLERIRDYPKRGYQIEQDIPDNIWGAAMELKRMGFDTYSL